MTVSDLHALGIVGGEAATLVRTGTVEFDPPLVFVGHPVLGRMPPAAPKPARKRRRCLRCRHEFWSKGAHNRLCGDCRQIATNASPLAA